MTFRIGQKVVCIAIGNWEIAESLGFKHPVKAGVYTIRELMEASGKGGLRLEEIRNPPFDFKEGFQEIGWAQYEFRPLVERTTDISVFQKMLRPTEIASNRALCGNE